MNDYSISARIGVAGGTITIILANINSSDLLKTAVLAATGAIVSFFVSYLLNAWAQRRRK